MTQLGALMARSCRNPPVSPHASQHTSPHPNGGRAAGPDADGGSVSGVAVAPGPKAGGAGAMPALHLPQGPRTSAGAQVRAQGMEQGIGGHGGLPAGAAHAHAHAHAHADAQDTDHAPACSPEEKTPPPLSAEESKRLLLCTLRQPSQDADFLEFCDELLMDGVVDCEVGGEECGGERKGSLVVQAADGGGVRVLGAVARADVGAGTAASAALAGAGTAASAAGSAGSPPSSVPSSSSSSVPSSVVGSGASAGPVAPSLAARAARDKDGGEGGRGGCAQAPVPVAPREGAHTSQLVGQHLLRCTSGILCAAEAEVRRLWETAAAAEEEVDGGAEAAHAARAHARRQRWQEEEAQLRAPLQLLAKGMEEEVGLELRKAEGRRLECMATLQHERAAGEHQRRRLVKARTSERRQRMDDLCALAREAEVVRAEVVHVLMRFKALLARAHGCQALLDQGHSGAGSVSADARTLQVLGALA
jgi:hypothetical protein